MCTVQLWYYLLLVPVVVWIAGMVEHVGWYDAIQYESDYHDMDYCTVPCLLWIVVRTATGTLSYVFVQVVRCQYHGQYGTYSTYRIPSTSTTTLVLSTGKYVTSYIVPYTRTVPVLSYSYSSTNRTVAIHQCVPYWVLSEAVLVQ